MTASAIRDAELKRMEILDEKLKMLEKKLDARPKTCMGSVCATVSNILCSIPFGSILAMAPSMAGLFLMYQNHSELGKALSQFNAGSKSEEFTSNLFAICCCVFAVDVAALVVSFPATGPLREYVFGRVHFGALVCLVCLIGPCFMTLILVAIFVTFIGMFGAIQPVVYSLSLLSLTLGICDASSENKATFAKIIAEVLHVEKGKIEASLPTLCASSKDYMGATILFSAGLIIATLGQIWQLIAHMNNLEKVWNTKDIDDTLEKELVYDYFKTHQYHGTSGP